MIGTSQWFIKTSLLILKSQWAWVKYSCVLEEADKELAEKDRCGEREFDSGVITAASKLLM